MSKEEFALGSFLSAMQESNLNGRAMRAAMLKALGMDDAALAQPEPHSDDIAVDAMAAAMKEKLRLAREKGRGGWETCSQKDLSRMLREHVDKGDPRDVANFCAFLHALGFGIAQPEPVEPADKLDAARYRFCIDNNMVLSGGVVSFGWPIAPIGKQWNKYIDSAMAAAKGGAL